LPSHGDGVPLRVCGVAFEQVIGPDRDRDFVALIDFDDGEAFDLQRFVE
jgi:hypothetical protein